MDGLNINNASDYLLKIDHLSVHFRTEFDQVSAVSDISLQIQSGKTLAIVGESGSGKSVTALSIMQLLAENATIDKGSQMSFLNKKNELISLTTTSLHQIEKIRGYEIAMIFQEPMTSLNPLMRCGEQVAEAIRLHLKVSKQEATQQTIALFEEVKIPLPAITYQKYPHELSGGQKQRVMIAMAISCKPKLLIADEPTTALDVTVQKSIIALLKDLQLKYQMSILFITHDLNLVKAIADDVLVMYRGKCVEMGNTESIFSNPQHDYTKSLISCRPDRHKRVKFLSSISENYQNLQNSNSEVRVITSKEFNERIEAIESRKDILTLEDLEVWYPTKKNFWGSTTAWFKAVNGVNMHIKQGETMGLAGESGCGKTTIGKAIVKLTEITKGQILYKGQNIADFSTSAMKDFRKEVQIIFQDPYSSLNPRIPIGKAIREPMDVYGIEKAPHRKDKVISLLEKVGLQAGHYDRYPHEFSGGQRQRISIARALALNAQLIICDESVSALDVSVQAQVLNLLVSLRDEFNFTYLFISHDLNVIKHISDHICVMHQGLIVEQNNAEALYHSPQHAYTQNLLESLHL
jgi:peptide/nickel transport system ATP-binding protein